MDNNFSDTSRLCKYFESRWPELNPQRRNFYLKVGPGPTPSVHLFLFTSPCHAGRTRFLLFNYWKVFLTWVTGARCQEELFTGRRRCLSLSALQREPQYRSALVFSRLFRPDSSRAARPTGYAGPPLLPRSNKSPVWCICAARRNALGSRKWKPASVIILILRRLTQTSIQGPLVIEHHAHRSRWAFSLEWKLPDRRVIACRFEMDQV